MAVDTRNRRSSAINLTLPWRSMWPVPDGNISENDFQHIVYLYAGIDAIDLVPGTLPVGSAQSSDPSILGSATGEQPLTGTGTSTSIDSGYATGSGIPPNAGGNNPPPPIGHARFS